MKKGLYLTMVLVVMAVLAGCKSELQQIAGEYSYKISGVVLVDSVEQRMTNETGALHIIDTKDELLLTFNMLGGDVYTAKASLDNKELAIHTFERIIYHSGHNYKTTVSGKGNVWDENIVLEMNYKGMSMDNDSIIWENKNIQFVATRNK